MRVFRYALALALPLLLWQSAPVRAQQMSYSETKDTIERIKDRSDTFNDHFDEDLDTNMEDTVERFEHAAEQLHWTYDDDDAATASVRGLLDQAARIDSYMSTHPASPRLQSEWMAIRRDLDALADSYQISEWPSALARSEYPPAAVVIVPVQPGNVQISDLIRDIQANAVSLQISVRNSLSSSSAAELETNSAINQYMGDFLVSADRLKRSYSAGSSSADGVSELLARGEVIDSYMKDRPLSVSAQQNWTRIRNDLVRLAAAYNMNPAWLSR